MFGRVFFLSTYAITLAFLFLPAAAQENESVAALSSTYVIKEEERKEIRLFRKMALLKLKRLKLEVITDLNPNPNPTNPNPTDLKPYP